MSFLGQLYFNDYLSDWRQFEKTLYFEMNLRPREYGELLQKKRRRGKSQRKKRRGRK